MPHMILTYEKQQQRRKHIIPKNHFKLNIRLYNGKWQHHNHQCWFFDRNEDKADVDFRIDKIKILLILLWRRRQIGRQCKERLQTKETEKLNTKSVPFKKKDFIVEKAFYNRNDTIERDSEICSNFSWKRKAGK